MLSINLGFFIAILRSSMNGHGEGRHILLNCERENKYI